MQSFKGKKEMARVKKDRGQFYTVQSSYILDGFDLPPATARCILEPFAGKGDLLTWLTTNQTIHIPIESYDIDPKADCILQRDTLQNPPLYKDAWILTNPPFLARNKSPKKEVFDLYDTNDLYKCFLTSLCQQPDKCVGGIFILPAGFLFSPRPIDVRCRQDFLSKYQLTKVKYFEEAVFPDTSITTIAFSFTKSESVLKTQTVELISYPSKKTKVFTLCQAESWIVGGDIYDLPIPPNISMRRYVVNQIKKENETITAMTVCAIDSGNVDKIRLDYKEGYVYPAKECSRTYATMCLTGLELTFEDQKTICSLFNDFLQVKRDELWSLFLPQYREFSRKRIPFELVYRIILHLIGKHLQSR